MDAGDSTPFFDLITQGQVDCDTKLIAAQGTLGLRVDEQRAVLELLAGDADRVIARTAA